LLGTAVGLPQVPELPYRHGAGRRGQSNRKALPNPSNGKALPNPWPRLSRISFRSPLENPDLLLERGTLLGLVYRRRFSGSPLPGPCRALGKGLGGALDAFSW
jgi:hypothetical protein